MKPEVTQPFIFMNEPETSLGLLLLRPCAFMPNAQSSTLITNIVYRNIKLAWMDIIYGFVFVKKKKKKHYQGAFTGCDWPSKS